MKYIVALCALVILVGVGGYTAGKVQKGDSEPTWLTYTNEEYGYSVSYPSRAEMGEFAVSANFPHVTEGADYRTFYQKDKGDISRDIGTIFCSDTKHIFDSLSNDMTLKEYAKTIFDTKIKNEYSIDNIYGVVPAIFIQTEAKETFVGKEAYYFTLGEFGIDGLDMNMYTVVENPEGKKCIIEYPAFDFQSRQEPEILQTRDRWFNSFQWIK